jgi:pantoate--beta-alanine ligase
LALSSRNAYLNERERKWAPTLYKALGVGRKVFGDLVGTGLNADGGGTNVRTQVRDAAKEVIQRAKECAEEEDGVSMRLDYIELNWADTLKPVEHVVDQGRPVILSGAIWVGRTRLIDNVILGDVMM